jgi:hypothetical protein
MRSQRNDGQQSLLVTSGVAFVTFLFDPRDPADK